jgi:hypothetical protein
MKFYMTRFELKNNWKLVKIPINSISKNIDSSDEESDGKKISIFFISATMNQFLPLIMISTMKTKIIIKMMVVS